MENKRNNNNEGSILMKCTIDLSSYTDFEVSVLEETRKIPYGKTKTYADIAKAIGKPKAARAVGNALGKNKTPILIPCHRVVKSDGGPGGFSMGLEWKKKLLKMEEIR
ncbi:MAG: MGMT family protein [Proteobacteria bacterium]|nr:MGMT family protein [Pseudomonadota bacterium]